MQKCVLQFRRNYEKKKSQFFLNKSIIFDRVVMALNVELLFNNVVTILCLTHTAD